MTADMIPYVTHHHTKVMQCYRINASPRHRITAVKCYRINASPHHRATASPRHSITHTPHFITAHITTQSMSRIDNRSFSFVLVRSRSFSFVLDRSRSFSFVLVRSSIIDQKGIIMKVTIKQVMKDLPAVEALLMQPHNISFVSGDIFVDENDTELPDEMDIVITCKGIIVNDDRISIEFPDGRIADYEICSPYYRYIMII